MTTEQSEVLATICQNATQAPSEVLAEALDRSGFWKVLRERCKETAVTPEHLRIVIKPDLLGFVGGSPTATDPALVESLIHNLHKRGYHQVAVVAASDSSSLWAENREVLALADLLGYRFTTLVGRSYEFLDLRDDLVSGVFPEGTLLSGSSISSSWADAHVRILFCKNKTDENEGYALCVEGLIGILPLSDKDYFYRQRFDPGTVALELIRAFPPTFSLIDAIISCHGSTGLRAPASIFTGTIIASSDPVLADFTAALKMGVDPYQSRVNARVMSSHGLPPRYRIKGNLSMYREWRAVHPAVLDSVRKRDSSVDFARTVKPWLQQADAASFPLKNPMDARLHDLLAGRFTKIDHDPGELTLYVLINYVLGILFESTQKYRVMSDKDQIRRRAVALGIDALAFDEAEYEATLPELLQLRETLRGLRVAANSLRWRYVNRAVVFEIKRIFPVPFHEFISAIDVAKTIQFMNDYLGGTIVQVIRDSRGRVTHQAERNVYLPQPNYLALSGGDVIDVTKLEFVEYSDEQHRMCWKTVFSENVSADYDDGIVTFAREGDQTCVTIFGRQRFTLPPLWQAINLDLVPSLKRQLVSEAYQTFFQRTFSNFEALLEGRDIYIGSAWHDPRNGGAEPYPIEVGGKRITELFEKFGSPIVQAIQGRSERRPASVDAMGFKHFGAQTSGRSPAEESPDKFQTEFSRSCAEFLSELTEAVIRDINAAESKRRDSN